MERFWSAAVQVADEKLSGDALGLLEAENTRLQAKLTEHEATCAKLAGIEMAYKHVVEQMQQVVRNNERLVKLGDSTEVNELLTEIDRLQQQLGAISTFNQSLTDKVNVLTEEVNTASSLRQELLVLKAERDKLNIQVTQLADRNMELLSRSQQLETALAVKLNEIDSLKAQLIAQPVKLYTVQEVGGGGGHNIQQGQLVERNQFLEQQLKELYEKYGTVCEELAKYRGNAEFQSPNISPAQRNIATQDKCDVPIEATVGESDSPPPETVRTGEEESVQGSSDVS